jgi:thiazole biosynthesis enzyme
MPLEETIISEAIIKAYTQELLDYLNLDVAVAGGGPSGLIAAYNLAKGGAKTAVFERRLSIGGGIWGGGIGFNKIVLQDQAKRIADELGIKTVEYKPNYHIVDAIEMVCLLGIAALRAGAKIFNLISIEDVIIRKEKVTGIVLNASAIEIAKLHVDPISIKSKYVIDATGHAAEIAHIILKKVGRLNTESGELMGEKSMWAEIGEDTIVKNSREFYPQTYVAGMAANAVFGGPRMGPIFGGMLLSGEKVAQEILSKLKK